MAYKRVLTIQDISCVGQCSLTVALPILSACGHETAILPSAVLSTHTAGFKGFTFRDLTSEMEPIREHWVKEGIMFDVVTTGYLGSREQIAIVKRIIQTCTKSGAPAIIDPAMADNGKLYPAFNADYVEAMKTLVALADFLLPNISEAAFLTGKEYRETYDEAYVADLAEALHDLGAKTVVLTGIGYRPGKTGVAVSSPGTDMYYYEHRKIAQGCHGTGDVYASAFAGAYLAGIDVNEAAKIAADFTVESIEATQTEKNHWYGVKFEPLLGKLAARVVSN
ncbi:MAG: pyridoxamine kinase [Sutterella sp.]|nr:pyridoxamine kinase [Sutterella sp.]